MEATVLNLPVEPEAKVPPLVLPEAAVQDLLVTPEAELLLLPVEPEVESEALNFVIKSKTETVKPEPEKSLCISRA